MKLYATTTSERASKGQGGNKFLCIEVQNEKKEVICEINCMPSFLTIRSFETEGLYIDYSELKLKGKSQKGEKRLCIHSECYDSGICKLCGNSAYNDTKTYL